MKIYTLTEESSSNFYNVTINGENAPVYTHYVSKAPINRRWPGHQREKNQREESYFVAFESDSPATLTVNTPKNGKPTVRPLSAHVEANLCDDGVTFTLTEHGAYSFEIGDGSKNLHIFFNKPKEYYLDDKCEIIFFENGVFDVGEIRLKSNQILYVAENAVVYCNIIAENATNVQILGKGILDNSKNTEKILFETKSDGTQRDVGNAERKHFICLKHCSNVKIDGVTLRDSLCYNVSALDVENLKIDGVKIVGCWRYNSDGIDMQNCKNAVIENCFIRTYDDCICVKGDKSVGKNCENITVKNCVLWCDWGHALEIGLETCAEKIRNVRYQDCVVLRTSFDFLHIGCADYAEISDVTYENVTAEFAGDEKAPQYQNEDGEEYVVCSENYEPVLVGLGIFHHFEYSVGNKFGSIKNVRYKNINVINAPKKLKIEINGADEQHKISDIIFENIFSNGKKADENDLGVKIKYGENVVIK